MRTLNRISKCFSIVSPSYFSHTVMLQRCQPVFMKYQIKYYSNKQISHEEPKRPIAESNLHQDSSSPESKSDSSSSSSESHSDSSSGESEDNERYEEETLRSSILEAALPFVKEYGWTTDAISKGAETLGYSSMVHGMFDKGGTDLVNYVYSRCNSTLEKELESIVEEKTKTGERIGTTEFIHNAVEIRLRMNTEYIESWPKALVLHASPTNITSSLNNIGTLVDTIWYYAGDRSYDFNWYTKRGILAAIYKSTELCMLQDKSEDFQDTWSFLDRRLGEVKTLGKCIRQTQSKTEDFGSLLIAGCTTIQNIVGLNRKGR